jgi:hypothetical protein
MPDEARSEVPESPSQRQEYEPPVVEDLPSEDGPAVTAAGKSPTGDSGS